MRARFSSSSGSCSAPAGWARKRFEVVQRHVGVGAARQQPAKRWAEVAQAVGRQGGGDAGQVACGAFGVARVAGVKERAGAVEGIQRRPDLIELHIVAKRRGGVFHFLYRPRRGANAFALRRPAVMRPLPCVREKASAPCRRGQDVSLGERRKKPQSPWRGEKRRSIADTGRSPGTGSTDHGRADTPSGVPLSIAWRRRPCKGLSAGVRSRSSSLLLVVIHYETAPAAMFSRIMDCAHGVAADRIVNPSTPA